MNEQLRQPVRRVIELLVNGKYAEIERATKGIRLSAQEMANAIAKYGRHLVSPPDDAFALMNVAKVQDSHPPRWSITIPLWTREEGRSDLSLEITLISRGPAFEFELDDIHVL